MLPMPLHPSNVTVPIEAPWGSLIPDDQWDVFTRGTTAMADAGVGFVLGGALALATYTRRWRNTKDVDVIVRPADHERAIAALQTAGFEDYHAQLAYDRSWIFRGFRDGVIFDIIWELPNHRVTIDDDWVGRRVPLDLRGRRFFAAPPEELIRVKLYVMQRERCDWVDVLNVLGATVPRLDWGWLVRRMGRDVPLLQGVLAVFNWMCPGRAREIPEWVRRQFALDAAPVEDEAATEARRIRLFDSRPWFAPCLPEDRPLER